MFLKKDQSRFIDKKPDELSGVKKKSFILPFAGGEIWFEHLDGVYQYSELALQKLRADAALFRRPSAPRHIAFVLDETIITDALLAEIADALVRPDRPFMRAAFVGADRLSVKKLKALLRGRGFAIEFFDGIEPAKEWLLGAQGGEASLF